MPYQVNPLAGIDNALSFLMLLKGDSKQLTNTRSKRHAVIKEQLASTG